MLKHVVSWKIADAASPEGLGKIASIVAGLESLAGTVPSIRWAPSVVAQRRGPWPQPLGPSVWSRDSPDDEAGLEAYHPEHQKVGAHIRSQYTAQATVDFPV
jgi:hypothetical protein